MNYTGFWRRLAAICIDSVFASILTYGLLYIIGGPNLLQIIIGQHLFAFYFIFLWSSKYQATLGMKALNFQIADTLKNRLNLKQSLIRYIVLFIPMWPLIILTATMENPEDAIANNNVTLASLFSMIAGLIWLVPIAFTKEKTGIADLICKTRVFTK